MNEDARDQSAEVTRPGDLHFDRCDVGTRAHRTRDQESTTQALP